MNNYLIKTALYSLALGVIALSAFSCSSEVDSPRIVNIVNFIRLTEPRDVPGDFSDEALYQTVVSEAECLREHNLVGTYLLQYDALLSENYQTLMKSEMQRGCEVGGWWEITEPHVKAAGLEWRGMYPWDWHTNVGFSVGYTPEEREKLVDVYMEEFKNIFGSYPSSIGSWFIDAHSLAYMYDKYHISASCMCRDQIGTDGYTLWGGYWNQAYYPSRKNAYMPAQTEEGQIGVPVFRMLGSDPIYQYEAGIGGAVQSVATLEPVCWIGGGTQNWVDWFFKVLTEDPALGFNYTQAGQENSFTWRVIENGFRIQMTKIDSLSKDGLLQVQTLKESGEWYKKRYPVTPVTSFAALSDIRENRKTLWFDCRNYRTNLMWKDDNFVVRDIHIFDENLVSPYLNTPTTSTQCWYETLPLVDGCLWSRSDFAAGMRLYLKGEDGIFTEAKGNDPEISSKEGNVQIVKWALKDGKGSFEIRLDEGEISISAEGDIATEDWTLRLTAHPEAVLPFTTISEKSLDAVSQNYPYTVKLSSGSFSDLRQKEDGSVFEILPEKNRIRLQLGHRE